MKLSSLQLSAFFESAQARNFSEAASRLGITQSALSQRISALEDELEATLFIRDSAGPRLTEAGELLLKFCQVNGSLEEEVLAKLKKKGTAYAGIVRIGGFSSVLRSAIIPAMAGFLRENPSVQCEFRSYEVVDLPAALKSAEMDYVVLDYRMNRAGIEEYVLGQEEYVVIEGATFKSPKDIYLDHGPHDNATEQFFHFQGGPERVYRRSFMGDVYGILDGVAFGLGRAVMSKHLLKGNKKVKVVSGHKRYLREVTLHHNQQPYYSDLQKRVVDVLTKGVGEFL